MKMSMMLVFGRALENTQCNVSWHWFGVVDWTELDWIGWDIWCDARVWKSNSMALVSSFLGPQPHMEVGPILFSI